MQSISRSHITVPLSLPFTRRPVDRHDSARQDPDWLSRVWSLPETRVLVLRDSSARLLRERLVWEPPSGEVPADAVYLGQVPGDDGAAQHLVAVVEGSSARAAEPADGAGSAAEHREPAENGETSWVDLREVGEWLEDLDATLFAEAVALTRWHRVSSYCPRCGTLTEPRKSGWMRWCPGCSTEHFPRTDPAVITAVVDGDERILLGSAHRWGPDRFSTFAGFVEAGESLEQAVVREVAEEAGVQVQAPRYLGSQPWPFPRSLMLGYIAQVTDPGTALADDEEIREVRWFTREELAEGVASGGLWLPSRASISRALIEYWYGGRIAASAPEPTGGFR